MKSVTFSHLFTGKAVEVFDANSVLAVIHGDATLDKSTVPNATWVIISNISNPIPVKETSEEVKEKVKKALTQE